MSNRTNVDFMLSNSLQRSETPSHELLKKTKLSALNGATVARAHTRSPRFAVVALSVVILLTLSTAALAYTGALSDIFSTIRNSTTVNGGIGNNSRKAIVDHGYFDNASPGSSVTADGKTLELIAYFADSAEIGFNLRLTSAEPFDELTDEELLTKSGGAQPYKIWDNIFFNTFRLEMTGSDGTTSTWEQTVDFNGDFEIRTFPGGYSYYDRQNNIFKYEPTDGKDPMESIAVSDVQDFHHYAVAERVDNNTYDITLIVSFYKAQVQIGEKAHLRVGDMRFTRFGNISDDTAVDQHMIIDDVWEFDLDFDSRFTNIADLQYLVVNNDELEDKGIYIEDVSVLPSMCKIEASIDFSKAGLSDPDNINKTDSPRQLGKLDWLDTYVYAVSADNVYGFIESDYTEVNGRTVRCRYKINSMFFDAPESLTLKLEGYGGATVDILLELND